MGLRCVANVCTLSSASLLQGCLEEWEGVVRRHEPLLPLPAPAQEGRLGPLRSCPCADEIPKPPH